MGPELADSSFDKITMLDLGTYTPGGLPLQFPDAVSDDSSMLAYFKKWKPDYPAGTQRRYSNPSIGLFGYLAARSMDKPFDVLMEQKLLPAFGLKNTFINVPESQMKNYAYGYSKANKPIRVSGGALDAQAYGIKTTALDLARFVELNIDSSSLEPDFQKAVAATHTGYYRVDANNQGLGWEFYNYPTALKTLLEGNSSDMALKSHKIEKFDTPSQPSADVWLNKTGSTNGFGAYAAFIPAKKIGIVLLANRNYPIDERVNCLSDIAGARQEAIDRKRTPENPGFFFPDRSTARQQFRQFRMHFLKALHPALELGTVTFPFALEAQRQIAQRGGDSDMTAMQLARQTWRCFVQKIECTFSLAPLQVEPGLMNLFFGTHTAFIDMCQKHVAETVGDGFIALCIGALFGITREELVTRNPVQILDDCTAVENRFAIIRHQRRNFSEWIGMDEVLGFRRGVDDDAFKRNASIVGGHAHLRAVGRSRRIEYLCHRSFLNRICKVYCVAGIMTERLRQALAST